MNHGLTFVILGKTLFHPVGNPSPQLQAVCSMRLRALFVGHNKERVSRVGLFHRLEGPDDFIRVLLGKVAGITKGWL